MQPNSIAVHIGNVLLAALLRDLQINYLPETHTFQMKAARGINAVVGCYVTAGCKVTQ
jgi:hypothetical protein